MERIVSLDLDLESANRLFQVAILTHGADHEKHSKPGQRGVCLFHTREPRKLASLGDSVRNGECGTHGGKVADKALADTVKLVWAREERENLIDEGVARAPDGCEGEVIARWIEHAIKGGLNITLGSRVGGDFA